jgi:hypothetical protein
MEDFCATLTCSRSPPRYRILRTLRCVDHIEGEEYLLSMSLLSILGDGHARAPWRRQPAVPDDTADAATDPPTLASTLSALAVLRSATTLLPMEISTLRGAVHNRFTPCPIHNLQMCTRDARHVLAQAAVRVQTVEATPTISCP